MTSRRCSYNTIYKKAYRTNGEIIVILCKPSGD